MVLCMSSMILGGCIPSPKKQTEAITVEENPNMMYMLVGSYATPEEEGIKVYNFDEQNGNSQYISGIKEYPTHLSSFLRLMEKEYML